ncbi:hypothetical protein PAAG_11512 [Paracoccidioides lutzii Pb01]|uniref:Uncharacterized protein n=1 Tax=Paracoccidioides lutzii (strain ATCC MYA-826 / Pb01) TaxID=502779 RepID=A0A0A2VLR1_PARBA|nr:hypothetical protein PAAG_11512 [Paracoccidioides lutzii Pb01]KGQ01789.1 hypothetical protein PAAG_11512 [Paracoccidioides lutzii Pb01]
MPAALREKTSKHFVMSLIIFQLYGGSAVTAYGDSVVQAHTSWCPSTAALEQPLRRLISNMFEAARLSPLFYPPISVLLEIRWSIRLTGMLVVVPTTSQGPLLVAAFFQRRFHKQAPIFAFVPSVISCNAWRFPLDAKTGGK